MAVTTLAWLGRGQDLPVKSSLDKTLQVSLVSLIQECRNRKKGLKKAIDWGIQLGISMAQRALRSNPVFHPSMEIRTESMTIVKLFMV